MNKQNKKRVYISAIVSLLSLFAACELTGPEPKQASGAGDKTKLRIQIVADGAQSRTLMPTVAISDVKQWELLGAESGGTQSSLGTFSNNNDTLEIETGTWDFTLNGFDKDNRLILSGEHNAMPITPTTSSLSFIVDPITTTGTGNFDITIRLPPDAGITYVEVWKDGALDSTLEPDANGQAVFDQTEDAGYYHISFRFYNADGYRCGMLSEVVYVGANLTTTKTYEVLREHLNLTYIINYDSLGATTEEYYQYIDVIDAPKQLPRPDDDVNYFFGGWYDNAACTGTPVTEIPQGSTEDKHFYAKWTKRTLAESLEWLQTNATENGEYTITINADETIAPQTLSYSVSNVSITLVGGTTERTVSLSSTGSLFTIESGVTLTLGNNVTLQGRSDNNARVVLVNSGGKLLMESGSKVTGNRGGGVYVNGVVTMKGGEISGNSGVGYGAGVDLGGGSARFEMSGGKISGNNGNKGGGVNLGNNARFTMSGGEISGNIGGSGGGGVFTGWRAVFTMSGGEISNNTAPSGGGVYMYDGAFTMSGGEISNNTANGGGGGVYMYGGGFAKSGGIIYGSEASTDLKNTASTGNGHAVYVNSGGKKRNSTAGEGVILNSAIAGSAGGWDTTVSFDANGGTPAAQTRTVSDGASLGDDMPPVPSSSSIDLSFDGWNTAQDGSDSVFTETTPVVLDITVYAQWRAATPAESLAWLANGNAVDGGEYTITLDDDASMSPQTLSYDGKTVSIILIGDATERTISLDGNGSLFTIEDGVTLTLGENITLEGLHSNTASLVQVNSGGELVMEPGSKITGNKTSYGGGVYVDNGSTFTMSGGEISGNTSTGNGGGVYVDNGSTFTMSNGTISGNNATGGSGGGVYVKSGTFSKAAGGIIYGSEASTDLKNTASSGKGHAVYVVSGGKKRNSTAEDGDTLNSTIAGSEGGWE